MCCPCIATDRLWNVLLPHSEIWKESRTCDEEGTAGPCVWWYMWPWGTSFMSEFLEVAQLSCDAKQNWKAIPVLWRRQETTPPFSNCKNIHTCRVGRPCDPGVSDVIEVIRTCCCEMAALRGWNVNIFISCDSGFPDVVSCVSWTYLHTNFYQESIKEQISIGLHFMIYNLWWCPCMYKILYTKTVIIQCIWTWCNIS